MSYFAQMNLQKKIISGSIALLVLPALALTCIFYYYMRQDIFTTHTLLLQKEMSNQREILNNYINETNAVIKAQMITMKSKLFMGLSSGNNRYVELEGDSVMAISSDGGSRNYKYGDNSYVDYIIDNIGNEYVATIFKVQGDKAIRISTTVKNAKGERAIGTELATNTFNEIIKSKSDYYATLDLFGKKYITMYAPLFNKDHTQITAILFIGKNIESFITKVKEHLATAKIGKEGYFYVFNGNGELVVHPKDKDVNYAKNSFVQEMISKREGVIDYSWKGEDSLAAYSYIATLDWFVVAKNTFADIQSALNNIKLASMIMLLTVIVLGGYFSLKFARSISVPIIRIASHLDMMAQKNFSMPVSANALARTDELGTIAKSLDHLNKSISEHLAQMKDIGDGLDNMVNIIAGNSTSLSSVITNTTKNILAADEKIKETVTQTHEVENKMLVAINTINTINDNSKKISQAISLITEIANQTNILAINASIEAAKAGEYGKGFAVVAMEIKDLAEKSSSSAKDISELLKNTITYVKTGVEVVTETGNTLKNIVDNINNTANDLHEISNMATEQSKAVNEFSSSSDHLAQGARVVNEQIMQFKV